MDRRWAIVGLIAIVAAFVGAGFLVLRSELSADEEDRKPGAWEVAWQYLAAFDDRKVSEAAGLTDDPAAARAMLKKVHAKLPDAKVVTSLNNVEAKGSTAIGEIEVHWKLDESRSFSYPNKVRLIRRDGGWLVDWTPALVHPGLKAGQHLAVVTRSDAPAVVDEKSRPLMTWGDVGPRPVKADRAKVLQLALTERALDGGHAEKWAMAAVDAKGKRVGILDGVGPRKAKAVRTTLNLTIQDAAQVAVNAQGKPAALVAIRPSTGAILAVAQNSAASQGPISLSGLYPPGSAFELVTATAALTDGSIPGHAKGFADIGTDIPGRPVVTAANQLGINSDFAVPGIETEAGAVRRGIDEFQQAEIAKGQGDVKVSPFGMALAAATVAAGKQVTPALWPDKQTRVLKKYPPPSAAVLDVVRGMMRQTVTSGGATKLKDHGKVYGKTGRSDAGDGVRHGWFTGYVGDLAFAVLVEDGGSAKPAVTVADRFLGRV